MAKNKKRRRASLVTKAINVGVLALAFSRVFQWLVTPGGFNVAQEGIIRESTFGLSTGKFDGAAGGRFYGPMVAAIILKKVISMVRRTARV